MKRLSGMTLLEVLIALSIFSLIGVASYRVLFSVINIQSIGDQHSAYLSATQKAIAVLNRDFQQLVDRPVRVSMDEDEEALLVNRNGFNVIFTRGGHSNPLGAQRSELQRVSYDIGAHPQHSDPNSRFYKDETLYLRRHVKHHLDQPNNASVVYPIMAEVDELQVRAISNKGIHSSWPLKDPEDDIELKALEVSVQHQQLGLVRRLYTVN